MRYSADQPNPDPKKYILVKTRDGDFWRVRRGQGEKGAALNSSFSQGVSLTKVSAPAAAVLRQTLQPWLMHMDCGRIVMRLSALIRRGLKNDVWPDYSLMRDFVFQPQYPIRKLLKSPVQFQNANGKLEVRIVIPADGAVVARNKAVTHYRFVLVLVSGDPVEDKDLSTAEIQSEDYQYGKEYPDCVLSTDEPDDGRPWWLLLRVICFEGKEMADSAGNAVMRVVGP